MKKITVLFIFILLTVFTKAQNRNNFSIHRQQLAYYDSLNLSRSQLDAMHHFVPRGAKMYEDCNLNKVVFGWFPYWQGDTYLNFEWSLLSDLSYFSYEVDPSTGKATTTHGWSTAAVIDSAQAHGVRVNLCVTLFSDHETFFGDSTAKQTLIDSLIAMVRQRNANGVNIDFEAVPSSQATNFNNFLVDLCEQMHSQIPGSQVSIALYAVDWSNVFDEPTLNNYLDYFIIMGYDYYYAGSSLSGPNDPCYPFTSSGYNLSRSVNYYLNAGISKEKLVLGLPYYGFDWPTKSATPGDSTTANASVKLYKTVMDNTSGYYSTDNNHWDNNSMSSYWIYKNDSKWHQCFLDDAHAMGKRLDLINQTGIAGMGIWALGYDDGYTDMWDMIAEKFSSCGSVPCSDTIYDNGGPGRNYYNNSDYTYTIAPTGAVSLSLSFNSLDLEAGYDSLWIYDGNDVNAPVLAALSGNTIPAPITASGNSLTLQFHSDGATVGAGWEAVWQCSKDNQKPITKIICADVVTDDFSVDFSDTDNDTVIGRWFNYAYKQDGLWSSYPDSGYFFDSLRHDINPGWISQVGVWQTTAAGLEQTDEDESNTNFYIPLNQNLSSSLVFSWDMKIEGAGTNRRAGIHFFCDSATSGNRHNSYMVYFRVDQNKVQIYKYVDNVYHLETDDDCRVDSGQWFNAKAIYNKISGIIDVYKNDTLVSSWTDASPYTESGDYLSLRTGNAHVTYKNMNALQKRTSDSVTIPVNNKNAFLLFSLICDGNKNLSAMDTALVIVDAMQTNTAVSLLSENSVLIYPNPATDNLTISINNLQCAINNVKILDLTGKEIMSSFQTHMPSKTGSHSELVSESHALHFTRSDKIRVSVKNLPAGIYFVKVETNEGTVVKKFVKQ